MKKLVSSIALFSLMIAGSAFAGTEISHLDIANAADFFKGDASNFRIDSLDLGKDPVVVTDVTDDSCMETNDTPADCHSYTYVNADVVHVNVSFDSDASQYEDGGNSITLSLPRSQFSAQELETIKHDAFGKSTTSLVKLSVESFTAQVATPDYSKMPNCEGDDDDFECTGGNIPYTTTNVSKVRVSVSR